MTRNAANKHAKGFHATSTRRRMFYRLVQLEDMGVLAANARKIVAREFRVDAQEVMRVEKLGMENDWDIPPVETDPE